MVEGSISDLTARELRIFKLYIMIDLSFSQLLFVELDFHKSSEEWNAFENLKSTTVRWGDREFEHCQD